jgi:integrase
LFHRDYADKLAAVETAKNKPQPPKDLPKSLAGLIDRYQKSPEFKRLAERTQEEYTRLLTYVSDKIGVFPYPKLDKGHVVKLRATLASTPRKADYMVSALSAVFTWKIDQHDEQLVNPCQGLKSLHRKADVKGHEPWTEDQIEFFLVNCKAVFRIPILLGVHTGQRLSDVILMRRNRFTGSTISVRTSKTNELVEVVVHPDLAQALADRPHPEATTFCVGLQGNPFEDPKSFSRMLAKEMLRLGLPRLTFHGLRYAACARLEDIGCTPYEVQDIVGHRTFEMAKQYMSKRRTRAKVQSLLEESAKSKSEALLLPASP